MKRFGLAFIELIVLSLWLTEIILSSWLQEIILSPWMREILIYVTPQIQTCIIRKPRSMTMSWIDIIVSVVPVRVIVTIADITTRISEMVFFHNSI